MQHIGLLGGTFDPIHNGHVHLAKAVLHQLNLDEVRLIPCYRTVHREQPIASPEQRLAMTHLACEGSATIRCDDSEMKRGGSSYMVETLETIKQAEPSSRLHLIIGYDAFMNFKSWKNWQGILTLSHVIVAKRPDYDQQNDATTDLIKQYGADLNTLTLAACGKICVLEISALDISSTLIRKNIHEHKDLGDVLPPKVYHFIKQEGLYAN